MQQKWLSNSIWWGQGKIFQAEIDSYTPLMPASHIFVLIWLRPPWQLVIFIIKKNPCIKVSKEVSNNFEDRSTGHCTVAAYTWSCLCRPENYLFPVSKNTFSWIKVSNKILHFILKTEALVTVVPVLWVTAMERATRHPKQVPYNAIISGHMD